MNFRPGPASDLLCPEPGSTTGRAIASLALRALNERLSGFEVASVADAEAREVFGAFVAAMDGLLPGNPKARVAVLASPLVRGPLEWALDSRAPEALVLAARAGLVALGEGALMPELIHEEGALVFAAGAPLGFAHAAELTSDARARVQAAYALLLAAASPELDDLPRFFPVTVLSSGELEVRAAVLGLPDLTHPLELALAVLQGLSRAKLEAYGALVSADVRGLSGAAEAAVRRAFLRRLSRSRHPIASTEAFAARLSAEEASLSRASLAWPEDPALFCVADELRRLMA